MENVIIKQLNNGLKVVYLPFPGIDSVTLRLFGRAGSMWENLDQMGIAHFVEHMVFEGSNKYPKAEKLSKVVSDVGGKTNGFTSEDIVGYTVKLLKSDVEKGFEYLAEVVLHPLIKDEDVEKQREIISQEIKTHRDVPVRRFFEDSRQILFPKNHRLGWSIAGTLDSVAKITRKQIIDFKNTNYNAGNFVLGICGDLDEKEVEKLAKRYFSKMPSGKLNKYTEVKKSNELKAYAEARSDIQQSTVSLSFGAYDTFSKKKYAAKVMSRILGTGDLSRLFIEIRQKRALAYDAGSYYAAEVNYGLVDLYAQIDEKNIWKVLDIMNRQIELLKTKPVSTSEYTRAKKHIISNFVFNQEKPGNVADFYTELVLMDKATETYESVLANYQAVTKEDIMTVANEIFSTKPKIRVLSNTIKEQDVLDYWKN